MSRLDAPMNSNSLKHISMSMASDPENEDFETLGTFIINSAKEEDTPDLSILIQSIGTSCKYIANCVRKVGLANLAGKAGSTNVQGEAQMKLDVIAHEVFVAGLDQSERCTVLVSEETKDIVRCKPSPTGRYVCVFDPLDGSSNIACGVSIGSIFGVYKASERGVLNDEDTLQPGKNMVAAGYCMYGSSCMLVLTIGGAVQGFTLDSSLGEFVLTHRNITVPSKGSIYSINEGNSKFWDQGMIKYVEHVKQKDKPHSLRYIAVSYTHLTLPTIVLV